MLIFGGGQGSNANSEWKFFCDVSKSKTKIIPSRSHPVPCFVVPDEHLVFPTCRRPNG
jgi:hypothetical protein